MKKSSNLKFKKKKGKALKADFSKLMQSSILFTLKMHKKT